MGPPLPFKKRILRSASSSQPQNGQSSSGACQIEPREQLPESNLNRPSGSANKSSINSTHQQQSSALQRSTRHKIKRGIGSGVKKQSLSGWIMSNFIEDQNACLTVNEFNEYYQNSPEVQQGIYKNELTRHLRNIFPGLIQKYKNLTSDKKTFFGYGNIRLRTEEEKLKMKIAFKPSTSYTVPETSTVESATSSQSQVSNDASVISRQSEHIEQLHDSNENSPSGSINQSSDNSELQQQIPTEALSTVKKRRKSTGPYYDSTARDIISGVPKQSLDGWIIHNFIEDRKACLMWEGLNEYYQASPGVQQGLGRELIVRHLSGIFLGMTLKYGHIRSDKKSRKNVVGYNNIRIRTEQERQNLKIAFNPATSNTGPETLTVESASSSQSQDRNDASVVSSQSEHIEQLHDANENSPSGSINQSSDNSELQQQSNNKRLPLSTGGEARKRSRTDDHSTVQEVSNGVEKQFLYSWIFNNFIEQRNASLTLEEFDEYYQNSPEVQQGVHRKSITSQLQIIFPSVRTKYSQQTRTIIGYNNVRLRNEQERQNERNSSIFEKAGAHAPGLYFYVENGEILRRPMTDDDYINRVKHEVVIHPCTNSESKYGAVTVGRSRRGIVRRSGGISRGGRGRCTIKYVVRNDLSVDNSHRFGINIYADSKDVCELLKSFVRIYTASVFSLGNEDSLDLLEPHVEVLINQIKHYKQCFPISTQQYIAKGYADIAIKHGRFLAFQLLINEASNIHCDDPQTMAESLWIKDINKIKFPHILSGNRSGGFLARRRNARTNKIGVKVSKAMTVVRQTLVKQKVNQQQNSASLDKRGNRKRVILGELDNSSGSSRVTSSVVTKKKLLLKKSKRLLEKKSRKVKIKITDDVSDNESEQDQEDDNVDFEEIEAESIEDM